MWIFINKLGFFSAVEHLEDANKVLIRARAREDIERLAKALNSRPQTIFETPEADYAFRLTTTKETWANLLSSEARRIDYNNFKKAALSLGDAERSKAYHDVWSAMYRLQEREKR